MDTAAFGVDSKGICGKDKAQDRLLPRNGDVPSLCSPPDLLNACALHQPPPRRMLQKQPLESSIVPIVPAGSPKIPIKGASRSP